MKSKPHTPWAIIAAFLVGAALGIAFISIVLKR
jgi:hypothetical protein